MEREAGSLHDPNEIVTAGKARIDVTRDEEGAEYKHALLTIHGMTKEGSQSLKACVCGGGGRREGCSFGPDMM